MARATTTPQRIVEAGIVPTYAAPNAVDGTKFIYPGRNCYLEVINADDDTAVNVDIVLSKKVAGVTPDPRRVTVAFGTRKKIKLGNEDDMVQADGYCYINWDTATGITQGIFYE